MVGPRHGKPSTKAELVTVVYFSQLLCCRLVSPTLHVGFFKETKPLAEVGKALDCHFPGQGVSEMRLVPDCRIYFCGSSRGSLTLNEAGLWNLTSKPTPGTLNNQPG